MNVRGTEKDIDETLTQKLYIQGYKKESADTLYFVKENLIAIIPMKKN